VSNKNARDGRGVFVIKARTIPRARAKNELTAVATGEKSGHDTGCWHRKCGSFHKNGGHVTQRSKLPKKNKQLRLSAFSSGAGRSVRRQAIEVAEEMNDPENRHEEEYGQRFDHGVVVEMAVRGKLARIARKVAEKGERNRMAQPNQRICAR